MSGRRTPPPRGRRAENAQGWAGASAAAAGQSAAPAHAYSESGIARATSATSARRPAPRSRRAPAPRTTEKLGARSNARNSARARPGCSCGQEIPMQQRHADAIEVGRAGAEAPPPAARWPRRAAAFRENGRLAGDGVDEVGPVVGDEMVGEDVGLRRLLRQARQPPAPARSRRSPRRPFVRGSSASAM